MSIKRIKIIDLVKKEDDRGYFYELIQAKYVGDIESFGLVYISQAKYPGVVKGNHYHKRKIEWFCVIKGTAELYLKDKKSKEEMTIIMGEDNMKMVKVEPYIIHAFKSVGAGEMILLAYISEPFIAEDSDTYFEKII